MLPVVSLLLAMLPSPGKPAPLPGERVIQAAHAMYHGTWFKTATFVQKTTFPAERRLETWYTAIQTPGLMRVDVAPASTGRAFLYRNDSTYEFGRGQLRATGRAVQPLLVLLHDLHSAPPAHTIAVLRAYGFDLRKTHQRVWDGERVIVVGALAGDTVSNQFWLEKKRMILVRLLEQNGQDPNRPLDARVLGYQRAGPGWLERSVRMFLGGQLSTIEDYTNVEVDVALEPGLFEPLPYRLPQWVRGGRDIFGGLPEMPPRGGRP